jgi:transcriptional regulator with XRE-family HTH domain
METNIIDPYVGTRIRNYRKKLGWTLTELGEKLEISPQQMQKYEQGKTRISVNILYKLSLIMAVKSDYFFEGFKRNPSMLLNCNMEDRIPEERKRPIDVLLVENDPEEALITRKAIEKSNVAVNFHLLHTGKQALNFLKNGQSLPTFPRPEIIILELSIPKGEGYLTLKEIKRDRRLCDIPVIVLANSVDRGEMMKAYQGNAAAFIRKPLNFGEYCDYINMTLQYWSRVVTLPQMDSSEPSPLDVELNADKL